MNTPNTFFTVPIMIIGLVISVTACQLNSAEQISQHPIVTTQRTTIPADTPTHTPNPTATSASTPTESSLPLLPTPTQTPSSTPLPPLPESSVVNGLITKQNQFAMHRVAMHPPANDNSDIVVLLGYSLSKATSNTIDEHGRVYRIQDQNPYIIESDPSEAGAQIETLLADTAFKEQRTVGLIDNWLIVEGEQCPYACSLAAISISDPKEWQLIRSEGSWTPALISPDNKWLLYEKNGQIFKWTSNNTHEFQPQLPMFYTGNISPNGRYLAINTDLHGPDQTWVDSNGDTHAISTHVIEIIDLHTGHQLIEHLYNPTPSDMHLPPPQWSHDSQTIGVSTWPAQQHPGIIDLISIDGQVTQIPGLSFAFSPNDNNWIITDGRASPFTSYLAYNLDTKTLYSVPHLSGRLVKWIEWSPAD